MSDKVADESTPPKARLGWKVIAIGVAVILVIAGGGTFAVLKYFRTSGTAAAAEKAQRELVHGTLNLEPFLVNLADKDAARFVKVTFRLGVTEKKAEEEIGKDPVFLAATRDSIISLLSSKTSDEILTLEGKTKLRREVQARVNSVIPKGKVLEVYIVDFVVQL